MINAFLIFILIFLELRYTYAFQSPLYNMDYANNMNGILVKIVGFFFTLDDSFLEYVSFDTLLADYTEEAPLHDYGIMEDSLALDKVRKNEEFRRHQDYLDYLQGSLYPDTESDTGNENERKTKVLIVASSKVSPPFFRLT